MYQLIVYHPMLLSEEDDFVIRICNIYGYYMIGIWCYLVASINGCKTGLGNISQYVFFVHTLLEISFLLGRHCPSFHADIQGEKQGWFNCIG